MGKLNIIVVPQQNLLFPLKVGWNGGGRWQQMLYFPGQKRSRNCTESSLVVKSSNSRSETTSSSSQRTLVLRATDQTTQNNFPVAFHSTVSI